MTRIRVISAFSAALCVVARVLSAQVSPPSLVDVGGHKLNVQVAGTTRVGTPTVVFESGAGSPLIAWNGVNLTVADSTKTIAYERAGIGSSEPGKEAPTMKHIVADLHALLAKLGAAPPYVFVGHSLGGPIIHSFAATYPKEIAGLVYVDPTDFTQTNADMDAIWQTLGVKNGRDSLRKLMTDMTKGAPAGVAAEYKEFDRVERGGFAEFREAGEAPDVPTTILLAGKAEPLPPGLAFPGSGDRYFRAVLDQRIDHFSRLAERGTRNTVLLTTKSSHFIHLTEPELVVWGIRRTLAASASHPELDRFVGQYPLVPGFTITITRDGDKLVLQATNQPQFPMVAESATTFSINIVNAKIEFETDVAGNVTALVLVQNGARQRAPKAK